MAQGIDNTLVREDPIRRNQLANHFHHGLTVLDHENASDPQPRPELPAAGIRLGDTNHTISLLLTARRCGKQ